MTDLHRFFYAIRPDSAARSMAVHAMHRQMVANGLSGSHVSPKYLHVTLHWLGDYEDMRMSCCVERRKRVAVSRSRRSVSASTVSVAWEAREWVALALPVLQN